MEGEKGRLGITRDNFSHVIAKGLQDAESCIKLWLRKPEYMIIAEHNKYPIGVLLLSSEISPVIDKKTGMLCYIAVDEKYRRRGVGTTLIEKACERLRQDGRSRIEVDVSA